MALEPCFSRGSRGEVVLALQRALMQQQVPKEVGAGTEPALAGMEDAFGIQTQRAVQRVQRHRNLLMTGAVDLPTWRLLMGAQPWPDEFDRMVQVVAGMEGHFFTNATGDRPPNDSVGMTWGLVGFALLTYDRADGTHHRGPLSDLLDDLFANQRDLMVDAFGKKNADALAAALKLKPDALHTWAVKELSSSDGKTLRSPWQQGFQKLGEQKEVQNIQRTHARKLFDEGMDNYTKFVASFSMACERARLYFFDFRVNTGFLSKAEKSESVTEIQNLIQQQPDAPVAAMLDCITQVVIKHRPRYAKDIGSRKGMISNGIGSVHGIFFRLDGWGIDVSDPGAAAPEPPRLAIIGLDGQRNEQLALARETKNLRLAEEAGADPLAHGIFPSATGQRLLDAGGSRSVATSCLAAESATLNRNFTDHYEAAQMLFRGKVGVLALSGQFTNPLGGATSGGHYVLQSFGKTVAGIRLDANDRLMFVRRRGKNESLSDSTVDITELRRSLSTCSLLMLYGAFGIPGEFQAGCGERWRNWIKSAGGDPLVLGWHGNVRGPQDALQTHTVSDVFLRRLALVGGGTLMDILAAHPAEVIEQWGLACQQVFSASKQPYLWQDEPVPTVVITRSGAGAIDRGGAVWRANPSYGKPGEPAMMRA